MVVIVKRKEGLPCHNPKTNIVRKGQGGRL